ncbi:hydroxymethylbilane synthase [Stomatohabitans albus]|uniref:hydroxymethylbilane synthase n=1 Tax=Stomatohabitans albus TaxID=3110766 RepID=UPI00300C067A
MGTHLLSNRSPLRVATRRSDLALAQSAQTVALIQERCGLIAELVPMSSTGDDHPERALDAFDRKGIFLDSLRDALLSGTVDMAIHSCKDVPTDPTPGLAITAIPPRADSRDVLVSMAGFDLDSLPRRARVGTSSARRSAQLLAERPDLIIEPIRGNVPTRIGRIHRDLDAVVLAGAGLARLQTGRPGAPHVLNDIAYQAVPIDVNHMVPAPAQGILAIEHRDDDHELIAALAPLNDPQSARAAHIERSILADLGGGCSIPLGVHADFDDDGTATVRIFLGRGEGHSPIRLTEQLDADTDAVVFARDVVATLKQKGA